MKHLYQHSALFTETAEHCNQNSIINKKHHKNQNVWLMYSEGALLVKSRHESCIHYKKLLCKINKHTIKVKKALKKWRLFILHEVIFPHPLSSLTIFWHHIRINVFKVIYIVIKVLKQQGFSYRCVIRFFPLNITIVVSCFSSNCEMSVLISESNKVVVVTGERFHKNNCKIVTTIMPPPLYAS